MKQPDVIDAQFRVAGEKPAREPVILWKNVPLFLLAVASLVAANWVYRAVMGH